VAWSGWWRGWQAQTDSRAQQIVLSSPVISNGLKTSGPHNQHVKAPPSGIPQHAVERRAAFLCAAEPVVYVLMFGCHAQTKTLCVLAEFSQLVLRIFDL